MNFIEGVAVGLVVGIFCPSLARKLKALWVNYTQKAVVTAVENEAKKV